MDRLGGPRPLLRPKVLSFCHSLAWIREAVAPGQAPVRGTFQNHTPTRPAFEFDRGRTVVRVLEVGRVGRLSSGGEWRGV